jgi:hypothetical protein
MSASVTIALDRSRENCQFRGKMVSTQSAGIELRHVSTSVMRSSVEPLVGFGHAERMRRAFLKNIWRVAPGYAAHGESVHRAKRESRSGAQELSSSSRRDHARRMEGSMRGRRPLPNHAANRGGHRRNAPACAVLQLRLVVELGPRDGAVRRPRTHDAEGCEVEHVLSSTAEFESQRV